jgi:hypothetical protein
MYVAGFPRHDHASRDLPVVREDPYWKSAANRDGSVCGEASAKA